MAILDRGRIVREGSLGDVVGGQRTHIDLVLPTDADARRLAVPAGVEATTDGRQVDIATANPQHTLLELLQWAHRAGVDFESIRVGSPTLENAFLDTVTSGTGTSRTRTGTSRTVEEVAR